MDGFYSTLGRKNKDDQKDNKFFICSWKETDNERLSKGI